MKLRKVFAAAAAAASLLVGTVSMAFSDTAGHWAEDNINALVSEGALNGYQDGTFRPDNNITRAEASKLIWNLRKDLTGEYMLSFNDVDASGWSAAYIAALSSEGIINGYGDGTFRPENPITRAEFAKMTSAALGNRLGGGGTVYSDTVGHWAQQEIGKLLENGIIKGYQGGIFSPDTLITRAEASSIILRAMGDFKPSENTFDAATVVKVSDGDTITVELNGVNYKIRMIGVDTPESVHPNKSKNTQCGVIASDYTKSRLKIGMTVYLQKDVSETDRYGRLLRYVWTSRPSTNEPTETEIRNAMYNAELTIHGYAKASTYPPDVKYSELFSKFEREARDNNRGLWTGEHECTPEGGKPLDTNNNNNNNDSQPNVDYEVIDNNTGGNSGGNQNIHPKEKAYLYANGRIIGNKNTYIYHMPGQQFYERIKMENAVFFDSEADAQAAGYRISKR